MKQQISDFLGRIVDRYRTHKLKAAVLVLMDRVSFGEEVATIAKTLDATLAMTKSLKKHDLVSFTCTNHELRKFVDYVTALHNTHLTRIEEGKYMIEALRVKPEVMKLAKPATKEQMESAKYFAKKPLKKTLIAPVRGVDAQTVLRHNKKGKR